MSSIADRLAARRIEEQGTKPPAIPSTPTPAVGTLDSSDPIVATLPPSIDVPSATAQPLRSTATLPAPISGIDPDTAPEGSYIALNLNQFYISTGQRVVPINGIYDPSIYDEPAATEVANMLAHYAQSYGLVQAV